MKQSITFEGFNAHETIKRLHGAEHYIVRGMGDSVEHFHEYERLEFRKVESEVEA